MHLDALYMEKSGRLAEAAMLYERAGSSADANRVRASVVRDQLQRFVRRGGIASSSINRLSGDERRLVRAVRRAVACPSCGAEVGQQCVGSGGSPNSDSHAERRRLAGSLSFEQIAASADIAGVALAMPQAHETLGHHWTTIGGGNEGLGVPSPALAAASMPVGSA